jgi:hypothetical protein
MKRLLFVSSFLIVFMMAPQVMGDTVKVERLAGYFSGAGGEFTLSPSSGLEWVLGGYVEGVTKNIKQPAPPLNFQSFCIEKNEFVNPGSTYNAVMNSVVIAGGSGGPSPDPLSVGAAYLYYQFVKGILAGYDYNSAAGRGATAESLQNAIWWLEDERGDPGPGNLFRNAVITLFGSAAAAKLDNNEYPVAVLNLYTLEGGMAQDMLVAVPEPTTMLLLGSGLIGLAGYGRKKFFKK